MKYRITASLKAGHDFERIVFFVKASNVAMALTAGIKAMSQLGFKADDYDLAHSMPLAVELIDLI